MCLPQLSVPPVFFQKVSAFVSRKIENKIRRFQENKEISRRVSEGERMRGGGV